MQRNLNRGFLHVLLSGVLLAACGGIPEAEPTVGEEPPGTQQSALCAGTSVTTLSILGVSSYGGEAAGSGNWSVSSPANAVLLEYYVDGTRRSSEQRMGSSGTWYFSEPGMSCGSHTLQVRAYPMVVDSAGNRTTCWSTSRSISQGFTQSCPSATLSCSQGSQSINCSANVSGGTGPYTYFWRGTLQETGSSYGWTSEWHEGLQQNSTPCTPSYVFTPATWVYFELKVRDSTGMESPVVMGHRYLCQEAPW